MKKLVLALAFTGLGAVALYIARAFAPVGGIADEYTLRQAVVVRNAAGEAWSYERMYVQGGDGAHVQIEAHLVTGLGRCESGGIFTAAARVSYNTCTQARSTFPARDEVAMRNRLRRRKSCAEFLAGVKAGRHGAMWGVRTEEYVLSSQVEDAVYVVSPDLGCESLSEVHRWKGAGGTPSGEVTALTTKELKAGAEKRYFAAAENLHEMAPSHARNLWAAKMGHSTSPEWFQKANARLDARYRWKPANQ